MENNQLQQDHHKVSVKEQSEEVQYIPGRGAQFNTKNRFLKDEKNGEALIGANVYVHGNNALGTTTNLYGFYSLSLPQGAYPIAFSYLGYNTKFQSITLDKDTRINMELSDDMKSLEEIVITDVRKDENVRSTTMGKEELSTDRIKSIPAFMGEVDIIKAIQLMPGVQAAGEGNSGIYVRGGGPDQNLVLLDDAVVYNTGHLFGFFSVFNPDAVKDVKLIKGGIPAQYGGRISSILDVRLKEGNSKTREINGGIGTIFSRLSYEQPFAKGKGSFIVAGRRSYIDVLAKPFLNSDLKNTRFNFYDFTAKANYRINDKNTVYASGYFGRDVFGADFGFDWGNQTATARWNHIFNTKLFMNATAFYSNYDYGLERIVIMKVKQAISLSGIRVSKRGVLNQILRII